MELRAGQIGAKKRCALKLRMAQISPGERNPTLVRIGESSKGVSIELLVTPYQEVEARTGLEPVYTALQAGA